MCASAMQRASAKELAKQLKIAFDEKLLDEAPRQELDIYPRQMIRVIVNEGQGPIVRKALWGVQLPSFSEGEAPSKLPTFNIPYQTYLESKLYRPAWLAGNRCVFPVEQFYEFRGPDGRKERMAIGVEGAQLTMIAGLFVQSRSGLITAGMFTCEPNPFMLQIHDRMPAIIDRWTRYLSPELTPADAGDFLGPYGGQMAAVPFPKPKVHTGPVTLPLFTDE